MGGLRKKREKAWNFVGVCDSVSVCQKMRGFVVITGSRGRQLGKREPTGREDWEWGLVTASTIATPTMML